MHRTLRALLASIVLAGTIVLAPPIAPAAPIVITPGGYTPPPIKVAVVHSQTTLDWLNNRGTPSRYPHGSKEAAALAYLQGRGYDVTEIQGDRDLLNSDSLKQYDVILLPSMYALGKPASESIARYVAAGGGVVASMGSPRIDPAHAPPKGTKDHMNEWWWKVMGSNVWEWGPLSAVYQNTFVNDGSYTPVFTLKPNARSSIVASASEILEARGYSGALAGVTIRRDPGANIEMSYPLADDSDVTVVTNFNILTASVKKLYPHTYAAEVAARYGAGRSAKFNYDILNYLQNYSTMWYTPLTPTGFHQGEAAGAYLEASLIWAASSDGTVARSIDAATYASASARGTGLSARQTVRNTGSTFTKGTVRFVLYSPSGHAVKSWVKGNVLMMPRQKRSYSYKYGRKLGSGAYSVVASFDYGYPAASRRTSTRATLTRGGSTTTR